LSHRAGTRVPPVLRSRFPPIFVSFSFSYHPAPFSIVKRLTRSHYISRHCNGSTRAGLGTGQIRPRDVCPSATTHHRRVALKRNASFLSIVLGRHPSFHINISHLLHLSFTLAAPQTPDDTNRTAQNSTADATSARLVDLPVRSDMRVALDTSPSDTLPGPCHRVGHTC